MPGNTAETFLVHFFGTGLPDDRYVVVEEGLSHSKVERGFGTPPA